LQHPQVAAAVNLVKLFSVIKYASETEKRSTILPSRQRQILRVRSRTPLCGLSIMLVATRRRARLGGRPSRFTVNASPKHDRKLPAASRGLAGPIPSNALSSNEKSAQNAQSLTAISGIHEMCGLGIPDGFPGRVLGAPEEVGGSGSRIPDGFAGARG